LGPGGVKDGEGGGSPRRKEKKVGFQGGHEVSATLDGVPNGNGRGGRGREKGGGGGFCRRRARTPANGTGLLEDRKRSERT